MAGFHGRIWRICRAAYGDLSGEGARLYGGRWNMPGRAMVYGADSPALAALEVRVHLDLPFDLLPEDFTLIGMAADGLSCRSLATLPDDPQGFGAAWLAEGAGGKGTLLLDVPSVIVPESRNILINPAHPEAAKLQISSRRRFGFDPRLF